MIKTKKLILNTEKQFISLNDAINDFIKDEKGPGLVNVFVKHTTCAIKIMEGELLLLSDVNAYLEKEFPANTLYRHDMIGIREVPVNERINGFSHMRQLMFDVSQSIPTVDGKMDLGTWQTVFLIEFDPIRDREVIITYYQ